jgi:hypothetical protein
MVAQKSTISQIWSPNLVAKSGRQIWSPNLVAKSGRQIWSPNLVAKSGLPKVDSSPNLVALPLLPLAPIPI